MLPFTKASTSVFLIAVYATIFTGVLVSNSTPKIPKDTLGLDLNEAYYDLYQVLHLSHQFHKPNPDSHKVGFL